MGKYAIYDSRDLTTASDEILASIDRAVMATAFAVRDQARQVFIADGPSNYPHYRSEHFIPLAEGIMVGRLKKNHSVVVHALGDNKDQHLWKTRFFVGGTVPRTNRGILKKIDSVHKGAEGGEAILTQYINNAINNT